jgi:hypothetical protein
MKSGGRQRLGREKKRLVKEWKPENSPVKTT